MTSLARKWIKLRNQAASFFESQKGNLILKILHYLILAGVLVWLGYKLYQVGWQEVLQHLPVNPAFYMIYPLLYLSNPIVQITIYRCTWEFNVLKSVPAFLIKRIMNAEVLGYSGEVYFFAWLKNEISVKSRKIVEVLRDYNIISAGSTNIMSILLLSGYLIFGQLELSHLMEDLNLLYFGAGAVIVIVFFALAYRFRKYLYSTSLKMTLFVGGMHMVRMLSGLFVQIILWSIAIPEVPLNIWITYTALAVIVSRIPISNKQLIFVGLGVGMSGNLGVSEAAIFGLFGSIAALEKLTSFLLFTVFAISGRFGSMMDEEKAEYKMLRAGKGLGEGERE